MTIIETKGNLEALRANKQLSVSLSIADLSVWSLCYREGGILLTSDGTLRKIAKENKVATHGLLWVFDQIVKNRVLTVKQATEKLQCVFNQNEYYKADVKLYDEYEAMVTRWTDLS